jgi:hypothetical protein
VAGAPSEPAGQSVVAGAVLEAHQLREFCHALMFRCRFNATEAFLSLNPHVTRASAAQLGSVLLNQLETQHVLAEMAKSAVERNELDQDYIIGCWVAMSMANVMDYFQTDEKGNLTLRDLSKLDVKVQRNIAGLEVTTEKVNEMVTAQKIKLKLVDRRATLSDMAKAAELFGKIGAEEAGDIANAIEAGFERVRKKQGGRTFNEAGADITEAIG